jgi:hypothetical protein
MGRKMRAEGMPYGELGGMPYSEQGGITQKTRRKALQQTGSKGTDTLQWAGRRIF